MAADADANQDDLESLLEEKSYRLETLIKGVDFMGGGLMDDYGVPGLTLYEAYEIGKVAIFIYYLDVVKGRYEQTYGKKA